MGARQVKQSNPAEYCPVCYLRLENRMAATAHYRAHVKDGSLVERRFGVTSEFQLTSDTLFRLWWRKGMPERATTSPLDRTEKVSLEIARSAWLGKMYYNQRR